MPLHGGRVPKWLADRMSALGRIVVEALVLHYGRDEVLRRLAHPFWFQSLGCVMGMDWHSSGITTSVVGALKRGLAPVADELGIWVCGGRGRHSRRTPDELRSLAERHGLDGDGLVHTSRLAAKVDNSAVQDGFQIYLHAFVVAADGQWTIVQQGLNPEVKTARRYHWLSQQVTSFVEDPHSAIEGEAGAADIVNLADRRAAQARETTVDLVRKGPEAALRELRDIRGAPAQGRLALGPHLIMPEHHDVRPEDVMERRLFGALAAAEAAAPDTFEQLLLTQGLGPRTLASLALVSEVVHGAPSRFSDPARFSMAHGGKDGDPFPVPLKVYDETLRVYRDAVANAKLGRDVQFEALKRLDREARRFESQYTGPIAAGYMANERAHSAALGGMTAHGPAPAGRPFRRSVWPEGTPRPGAPVAESPRPAAVEGASSPVAEAARVSEWTPPSRPRRKRARQLRLPI